MPISPNMGLNIPVVSTTPGPQYAQDVNASLNKLDAHNHTSGQGSQIPTAGLNINASLPMNNYGLLNTSQVGLTAQTLPPATGTIYRSSADLYYVDGNGNNVRITQGGAVAVSGAVGFSGLPFGTAGASYNNGTQTFVFQSATNTAANVDCGSVILREVVASANGVTLSSPLALAASYTIRMPAALPANTSALLLTAGGDFATSGTVNTFDVSTINSATTNATSQFVLKNNTGVLQFRDATNATQFVALTGSSTGLELNLPDTADAYTFKVNSVTKAVIDNNGIDGQYIYGNTPVKVVTSGVATGSVAPAGSTQLMNSTTFTTTKNNAVITADFLSGSFSIFSGSVSSAIIDVNNGVHLQYLGVCTLSGAGGNVTTNYRYTGYPVLIPTAGTYTIRSILNFSYGGGGGTVDWTNVVIRIVQLN